MTRALVNLKTELTALRSDLDEWVGSDVWTQPHNGPRTLLAKRTKRAISQALIRAWRRQTPASRLRITQAMSWILKPGLSMGSRRYPLILDMSAHCICPTRAMLNFQSAFSTVFPIFEYCHLKTVTWPSCLLHSGACRSYGISTCKATGLP